MPQPLRDRVFISYSHKDKKWLAKLQTMLTPLVRNKSIVISRSVRSGRMKSRVP